MEELILEFKKWNQSWEDYDSYQIPGQQSKPLSIDKFVNKMKSKFKVIKK